MTATDILLIKKAAFGFLALASVTGAIAYFRRTPPIPPSPPPFVHSPSDDAQALLSRVDNGMTEQQLVQVDGKPDHEIPNGYTKNLIYDCRNGYSLLIWTEDKGVLLNPNRIPDPQHPYPFVVTQSGIGRSPEAGGIPFPQGVPVPTGTTF